MTQRVIALRGVNGSGKSWIVRAIMSLYPKRTEERGVGVRRPLGYWLDDSPSLLPCFVVGYYDPVDTRLGGTSTLSDVSREYELIWQAYDNGYSVLFEGQDRQSGYSRLVNMFHTGIAVSVIVDHALSECVQTIKDLGGRLRVETAQRHERTLRKNAESFAALGYDVHTLRRADALKKINSLLSRDNGL